MKEFIASFNKKIKRIESAPSYSGKNDHFIPQFLLRNFGIKKDVGKSTHIFEYKRAEADPKVRPIKKVASKSGFYDVKNVSSKAADNLPDRIETETIESMAVPLINKLKSIDSGGYLSDEELNVLSSFVSGLYVRTPSFRNQIKHYLIYLLENDIIKVEDLNKRTIKAIFQDNKFNIKIEDIRKFKPRKYSDIDFILNSHLVVISGLIRIGLSEHIFNRDVVILESAEDVFLINDNPVFAFNENEKIEWPFGFEFGEDQFVYLPISPNRCLCFSRFNKKTMPVIVYKLGADKEKIVDLINFNLIYRAEESVYFFNENLEIQKNLNQTKKLHNYNFC